MTLESRSAALSLVSIAVFFAAPAVANAQNTSKDVPRVIDVHAHAMDDSGPNAVPMCPNTSNFTASDPATKEAPFGWVQEECTPKLYPAARGDT